MNDFGHELMRKTESGEKIAAGVSREQDLPALATSYQLQTADGGLNLLHKLVTRCVNRKKVFWFGGICFNLLSERENVVVHRPGRRHGLVPPNVVQ